MTTPPQQDLTAVLQAVSAGDASAIDQLVVIVYDELRRLADHHLKSERPDHTLQATALAHEAYLRLIDQRRVQWRDRAHFFGAAANVIRRILVDHARGKKRAKRGGGRVRLSLDDEQAPALPLDDDLVVLDDALQRLAQLNERHARLVELRFFGGLSAAECAAILDISERTVHDDWRMARAWLRRALRPDESD